MHGNACVVVLMRGTLVFFVAFPLLQVAGGGFPPARERMLNERSRREGDAETRAQHQRPHSRHQDQTEDEGAGMHQLVFGTARGVLQSQMPRCYPKYEF